ncbi:putative clock controled protein (Ccg-8) [Aspergillus brunneoviolaceus CBS 621.78]|uniref:Clock controled protein (Ccg-8) n=1 Tax=Aspergillus brunneoviolaceus CBS 621.78 TaxID=1450534 RepID=A0ACD1FWP5_9EURO|nr:putative clock controled protein (Ccg-8) [Aspergillus brunneoviolaceus CBS 621.78]RAH41370.1 putative clock controled protein (Ccg-8) [Aspergillus brunneoviolaceus CBS 621.78]
MDHRPTDGISGPGPKASISAVRDATTPTTTTTTSAHPSPLLVSSTSTTSYTAPTPAPYPSFHHHVPPPSSLMDVDHTTAAEDRSRRATSVLSMDDIEAAQALEGLRTEYGQSPRTLQPSEQKAQPEPLLSLLTSTHPLISSAINGSVSAYANSKSYSPRFKSGAEFIERNIGSPVAKSVGTVGRKTGVESGLRWALQRRASSSANSGRSKRRKVNGREDVPQQSAGADVDVEKGSADGDMEGGVDGPPPYDDQKSPSYDEIGRDSPSRQNPTWQSRLMISTSGLGVAMSEESLRSLQYCLTWLRWANGRLGKAILALQGALKEWDNSGQSAQGEQDGSSQANLLSQRIQAVKEDVLSTLKRVVDIVSKYAGGALPENARNLVRRHLTSLPHRFQIASTSNPPPDSAAAASDTTVSAHRILVLAQEGLDMMAQVSGVVNDTLVSAEHWCQRLGRKRPESKNAAEVKQQPEEQKETYPADIKRPVHESSPHDVSMSGMEKV